MDTTAQQPTPSRRRIPFWVVILLLAAIPSGYFYLTGRLARTALQREVDGLVQQVRDAGRQSGRGPDSPDAGRRPGQRSRGRFRIGPAAHLGLLRPGGPQNPKRGSRSRGDGGTNGVARTQETEPFRRSPRSPRGGQAPRRACHPSSFPGRPGAEGTHPAPIRIGNPGHSRHDSNSVPGAPTSGYIPR